MAKAVIKPKINTKRVRLMIADNRLIIVRHKRRTHKTVQSLRKVVFGLFLVLLAFGLFSYTRAGVYTRTHTRAYAATSSNLNFQARLMASGGNIVPDGSYSIVFNLYNVASGGSTQWTETQSVTVKNGYLTVNLGSVSAFPSTIDWTQEQWLTMNVNGDGEMNPRLKLTAVPFAFQAAQLAKTSGGFKSILDFTTPTANRSILLPDASGTVALSSTGTFTNNGVLYGDGTSTIQATAAGTTGQCLVGNTGAAPSWGTCSSTLQSAYGNSTNPQITLNNTQGKITIQDNATPLGGNLFEITNNGGATKYLAISSAGVSTSGTLTSGGALTVTSGGASISGGLNNNTGGITNAGSITGVGANITATGALAITSDTTNSITIDSGTTGSVNVGTGASSKLVTVGSSTGTSTSVLQAGTGGVQITSGANITIGTSDTTGTLLVVDAKTNTGDPTGTNGAIYYNSFANKFRCFQNNIWVDCVGSGGSTNATASFVSGLANVGANVTGAAVETLVFTSATAVSNTAGVTGFTAPADGSFRSCLIKNNANITAGTLSLRWRVNGVSVGASSCPMNSTTNRQSASSLDANTVTFAAGDTIGVAFDTVGLAPTTDDFTVYWTVEYNAANPTTSNATLQDTYNNSTSPATILTADNKDLKITLSNTTTDANMLIDIATGSTGKFAVQNNGVDVLSIDSSTITASGALTSTSTITGTTLNGTTGINTGAGAGTQRIDATGNLLNIAGLTLSGAISGGTTYSGSGNINTTGGAIQTNSTTRIDNSGNLTNIGNITGTGALTLSSGGTGDLTLDSASNTTLIAANDTTLQRIAAGIYTFDLKDAAATTLKLTNSGAGVLDLNIDEGDLKTANTSRLTNSGALQNISSLTLSGAISGGTTFTGSGNINTTGGVIQTNSTTRIDNSGNLSNIGTLTLSGAISGGTTYSGSGNINTTGGVIQTNNTDRIDNSGNLVNIGNLTASGATTLSAGGTGTLTLKTGNQSAASTASAGLTITSGNASGTGVTSNSGNVTIDSGTSTNGTTGLVQIGVNNASGITLGRSGITTTAGGSLVVSGSSVSIGTSSLAGTLTLSDGSSNTGLFQTTALGSNRTYTLPDSTGTVCLDSNNCGYIQLGPSSVQTDSSTNSSININKTGATGNIVTLQKNGTGVFTIANGGATQISTTSTGAFNVSNASGTTSFFNIDTSGNILQVGSSTGDGTGILFVLDAKTTTDPGGTNGGMYYNSTNDRFRCYEGGVWKDCVTNREDLVAHWDVSSTKTNIGTAFVDVFTQANSDGKSMQIDTNDKTQVRLVVNWNKIGAGTQTVQILEVGTANVLATMNVVSGRNDSGLVNIPAFAVNSVKYYKVQAKSTTAADDPVFEGATLTLR